MVWEAFESGGTTPMVFEKESINLENYVDALAKNMLPEAPLNTCGDYLFLELQNHGSKLTKSNYRIGGPEALI